MYGCQRVGMPGLGSALSTCCPTKGPNGGVVRTPLPVKLLFLAFPSRRLDWNQKRRFLHEERTLRRSQTAQAQLGFSCKTSINSATPGLGSSVCYPPKKHHQWIVTTPSTHQATAFSGSDALAPPGSVGQVSNRQAEPLLRRSDYLQVACWNVWTHHDVGVQALAMRELRKYNACLSGGQNTRRWSLINQSSWWGNLLPSLSQWSNGNYHKIWRFNRCQWGSSSCTLGVGTNLTRPC